MTRLTRTGLALTAIILLSTLASCLTAATVTRRQVQTSVAEAWS